MCIALNFLTLLNFHSQLIKCIPSLTRQYTRLNNARHGLISRCSWGAKSANTRTLSETSKGRTWTGLQDCCCILESRMSVSPLHSQAGRTMSNQFLLDTDGIDVRRLVDCTCSSLFICYDYTAWYCGQRPNELMRKQDSESPCVGFGKAMVFYI